MQSRRPGRREDFKSGVACYRCNCYRTPLGAEPEHAVTVEPAAQRAVSQPVDRDDRLEHRHLDARGGCRLVDEDRKSTRLTPVTLPYLVCRLLLEKKKPPRPSAPFRLSRWQTSRQTQPTLRG